MASNNIYEEQIDIINDGNIPKSEDEYKSDKNGDIHDAHNLK